MSAGRVWRSKHHSGGNAPLSIWGMWQGHRTGHRTEQSSHQRVIHVLRTDHGSTCPGTSFSARRVAALGKWNL